MIRGKVNFMSILNFKKYTGKGETPLPVYFLNSAIALKIIMSNKGLHYI